MVFGMLSFRQCRRTWKRWVIRNLTFALTNLWYALWKWFIGGLVVEMDYTSRGNSRLLGFLPILLLVGTDFSDWRLETYIQLFLAIFLIALAFIRFSCNIKENSITYHMTWKGLTLYKKQVTPNQISHIKYKRYGWARKGAVIYTHTGFNIRLVDFTPVKIYEELDDFAIKHHIDQEKSKDYQLLEKLGWQE